MASRFDLWYEVGYDAGGAVGSASTLAMLPLRWATATLTLRRRAPDGLEIIIPRHEEHAFGEFDAWRELRIQRDGAWWWGGFLGAPTAPGGERAGAMTLPGYGAAAALTQFWQGHPGNAAGGDVLSFSVQSAGSGSRADQVIGAVLDICIRGAVYAGATRWFPAANRTLSVGTYTPAWMVFSGRGQLDIIQVICDGEGWEWRVGIDPATGDFIFKAGSGVAVDQTAAIALDSPANCLITGYDADATKLATHVTVGTRAPDNRARVRGNQLSGAGTLAIKDGSPYLWIDQTALLVGKGTLNEEPLEFKSPVNQFELALNASMLLNHDDGEEIVTTPGQTYIASTAITATTGEARHHRLRRGVINDQITSVAQRAKLAATYLAAGEELPRAATVEVTDPAMLDLLIARGVRPGDTVSLTSRWLPFGATAMVVQEMALTFERAALVKATLTLGDRLDDALAVLERMVQTANSAATWTGGRA